MGQKQERPPQDHRSSPRCGNVDIREANLAFDASGASPKSWFRKASGATGAGVLARLQPDKLEAALATAPGHRGGSGTGTGKLRPATARRGNPARPAPRPMPSSPRPIWRKSVACKLVQKRLAAPEEIDRLAPPPTAKPEPAPPRSLRPGCRRPTRRGHRQREAGLAARRAELALARERLDDATLLAPAPGIVRDRILEPGDSLTTRTPVLTLALNDPALGANLHLPESDLGRIRLGMAAEVHTDSYPDKTYHGWVGFLSPTAEFTPKNVETSDLRTRLVYQARIFVCNPQNELRLGMPATVTLALDQPPDQAANRPSAARSNTVVNAGSPAALAVTASAGTF